LRIDTAPDNRRLALLAEYAEINNNFRMLTEIRFKLLALLPLAAGGVWAFFGSGQLLGVGDTAALRFAALSAFGLVVTIFVATYNARNDQVYLWLVNRAVNIERELGLADGSFAQRPNSWFEVKAFGLRGLVGHSSSVVAIYGSSVALWLAGFLAATERVVWSGPPPTWAYGTAIAAAVLVTVLAGAEIGRQKRARRKNIQSHASAALKLAGDFLDRDKRMKLAEDPDFVLACSELIGRDWPRTNRRQEARARARLYGSADTEWLERLIPFGCVEPPEAYYVGLIVDLPAPMLAGLPQRREGHTAPGLLHPSASGTVSAE
jgi:hypothetical protein